MTSSSSEYRKIQRHFALAPAALFSTPSPAAGQRSRPQAARRPDRGWGRGAAEGTVPPEGTPYETSVDFLAVERVSCTPGHNVYRGVVRRKRR
jgi:hypothetical protein